MIIAIYAHALLHAHIQHILDVQYGKGIADHCWLSFVFYRFERRADQIIPLSLSVFVDCR